MGDVAFPKTCYVLIASAKSWGDVVTSYIRRLRISLRKSFGGRKRACSVLLVLIASSPLCSFAAPPQITMSHQFLSFTPTNAGVNGAEYRFTITNQGPNDLYDLRVALGVSAPEPVGPDGQPTLRVKELASGTTVTVVWTMTTRVPSLGPLQQLDLIGWVEAIDRLSGEIVSSGVMSRPAGEFR